MTETETKRIADLTTGAIKTTMEGAIEAMRAAVKAAEEKAQEMREATEQFIEDFEKVNGALAYNVRTHVLACQAAVDAFQGHHLKILNGEAQIPAENVLPVEPMRTPMPEVKPTRGPRPADLDLSSELGRLATLAAER